MNNRQRSQRLSRLRKSPGFPPSRRRQPATPAEGTTPTTPQTENPTASSSDSA
ncbi:hypothetical protein ACIQCR_23195 [Streptomyces sp. NPDC093249]|uniref:hypothetical protein n=1 Tax=unclassified Streptomyces TaxID=2593676 RepID=UPI0038167A72